jgi:hypothetical protein
VTTPNDHCDLDALADVLADDGPAAAAAHLSGCAECRAALDELRTASARVTAELSALPATPLPRDVAGRLAASLQSESTAGSATVTALSPRRQRAMRWLPAAAALAVLLAGVGYGLSQLGGGAEQTSTAGRSSNGAGNVTGPSLDLVRNSTGADYDGRAALAAAVPGLLGGTATAQQDTAMQAPAGAAPLNAPASGAPESSAKTAGDPLARLRSDAGLAECLLALLPPEDPSVRPLALDYATFRGAPAMVVVLPGSIAGKLDVFVVGPACSRADDSTLFYTSVDRP